MGSARIVFRKLRLASSRCSEGVVTPPPGELGSADELLESDDRPRVKRVGRVAIVRKVVVLKMDYVVENVDVYETKVEDRRISEIGAGHRFEIVRLSERG